MSDPIDAYLDGELSEAERTRFEARLQADASLRAQLSHARSVRQRLEELPREVQPQRDLWPEIDRHTEPRSGRGWLLPGLAAGSGGLLLAGLLAAVLLAMVWQVAAPDSLWKPGQLVGMSADPDQAAWQLRWDRPPTDGPIAIGHAHLRQGDLLAADVAFQAAVDAHPSRPDALIALAYTRMLRGEHDEADSLLARAQAVVPAESLPDVQLRRALVAFEREDLDGIKRHAEASGLPAGLVLAAEVNLADAEIDAAIPLLEEAARDGDPAIADTARTYLVWLRDSESGRAQLAEGTALWALGLRDEAVEMSTELLVYMPADLPERDSLLLLWAGRAAAAGRADLAETLLDEMDRPPHGQAWRVQATRALIATLQGQPDRADEIFRQLALGGAPSDGLRDARLTAALLTDDEAARQSLLAGLDGPGAALIRRDAHLLRRRDGALGRYLQAF